MAVDIDAIVKKAENFVASSSGQAVVQSTIDKKILWSNSFGGTTSATPQMAADKFIEVLKESIRSSGLSDDATKSIMGLGISHGEPVKIGNGLYAITVHFDGNLFRPSLVPEKYIGISDIVELLDQGVGKTMRPVFGTWHGKETWSRVQIPRTGFIENAISSFMSTYAAEYGVISIER